jgi:hypothetical protein
MQLANKHVHVFVFVYGLCDQSGALCMCIVCALAGYAMTFEQGGNVENKSGAWPPLQLCQIVLESSKCATAVR